LKLKEHIARYGFKKLLITFIYNTLNKILYLETLHIIVLERERIKDPKAVDQRKLTFRYAVEQDLAAMLKNPEFKMSETKMTNFREGDHCLLCFVDDELAGYTWAHTMGRPLLFPGFRISVPDDFCYNYAALTLPKFRGMNLQSIRHYHLMNNPEWKDKKGLLGYVVSTNWNSIKGQSKSGYHSIGRIRLFGTKKKFMSFFSKRLKTLGIKRLVA
jgi:hypothetical protein